MSQIIEFCLLNKYGILKFQICRNLGYTWLVYLTFSTCPPQIPRLQLGLLQALELLITDQNSSPHRDPGAAPVEKKKKGKRRKQEPAVQEGVESDDATSMSALNMGGEDSQDPLDNAVSAQWG